MCLGKLKATHWAPWPHGSGHYPLNLPIEIKYLSSTKQLMAFAKDTETKGDVMI